MKKVLITGGTGTVGSAFIQKYYNKYQFFSLSRGEEHITELKYKYPKVKNHIKHIGNHIKNHIKNIRKSSKTM